MEQVREAGGLGVLETLLIDRHVPKLLPHHGSTRVLDTSHCPLRIHHLFACYLRIRPRVDARIEQRLEAVLLLVRSGFPESLAARIVDVEMDRLGV